MTEKNSQSLGWSFSLGDWLTLNWLIALLSFGRGAVDIELLDLLGGIVDSSICYCFCRGSHLLLILGWLLAYWGLFWCLSLSFFGLDSLRNVGLYGSDLLFLHIDFAFRFGRLGHWALLLGAIVQSDAFGAALTVSPPCLVSCSELLSTSDLGVRSFLGCWLGSNGLGCLGFFLSGIGLLACTLSIGSLFLRGGRNLLTNTASTSLCARDSFVSDWLHFLLGVGLLFSICLG